MQKAIFLGASPSYFKADDGTVYDSTKIYLAMPLSQSGSVGLAGCEYKIGTSADFDKVINGLKPLAGCEVELDIQTNGKKSVVVLKSIRPLPSQSK